MLRDFGVTSCEGRPIRIGAPDRLVSSCSTLLVTRRSVGRTGVGLDANAARRNFLTRMVGTLRVHRVSMLFRLTLGSGMITSLLIRCVVTNMTCLPRILGACLISSVSRWLSRPINGLSALTSCVSNGLRMSGITRLTASAMAECSVSVVKPIEQPRSRVVVCMWWVTLLLPACPLESMWDIAVAEMPVTVVIPMTEVDDDLVGLPVATRVLLFRKYVGLAKPLVTITK